MKSYITSLFLLITISALVPTQKTSAQDSPYSWDYYYDKFTPEDSTLSVYWKNGDFKNYNELNKKERKQVNQILHDKYGVEVKKRNYLAETFKTIGTTTVHVIIYIATMTATYMLISEVL